MSSPTPPAFRSPPLRNTDFCAIDFGTSNSAVALPDSAGASGRLVELEAGFPTMPTAVFYLADGPAHPGADLALTDGNVLFLAKGAYSVYSIELDGPDSVRAVTVSRDSDVLGESAEVLVIRTSPTAECEPA